MSLETRILNDPSASYWLKEQIKQSKNRDPIDALSDAETLTAVLNDRNKILFNKEH